MTQQLRIESAEGQLVAEYRIRRGVVEVLERAHNEADRPTWRRLSAREFSAHLAQNPALGEWLRARAKRPPGGSREEESSAA